MKVYFLRHGQAGDREDWKGDDFARPLTDDGKARLAREAKALAKLDLSVDAVITSPLVRAKQTAEIVAGALGSNVTEDARLDPDFNVDKLKQIVRDRRDAGAIMLVGHEPSFSETIGAAVGGARIDLKKGGLAYVDLGQPDSVSGELVWLIPPKILAS